jgi:hypothetical protein
MSEKKVTVIPDNIEKLDETLPKQEPQIREKKQTQGRNKVVSIHPQEIPNFRFSGYLDIPIPRKVTDQRKISFTQRNEELEALMKDFGTKQLRKRGGSVRVTEPLVNVYEFQQIGDIKNSLLNSQLKSQIQGNNDLEELFAAKNFVAIRKLKQNLSKNKEEIKDKQFTQKLLKTVQKEKGKSTGFRPEAFLYTLKKININNKLDPEVGRISMQIHRFGTTGKVLPRKLKGLSQDKTPPPMLDKSAPFKETRKFLPAKLSKESEDEVTNLRRKCSSVKVIDRGEIALTNPSKFHKRSKEFDEKIVDKSADLSDKMGGSNKQGVSMIPQKQVDGSGVNQMSFESEEEESRERFETLLKVKDIKKTTNKNQNNQFSIDKESRVSLNESNQVFENNEMQIKVISPDSKLHHHSTLNEESKHKIVDLSNINESAVIDDFKPNEELSKQNVFENFAKGKFRNVAVLEFFIDPIVTQNLTRSGNLFVKIINVNEHPGEKSEDNSLRNSSQNVDKSISFNVGTELMGTQRFEPRYESKRDDSVRLDYSFNPEETDRKNGPLNSGVEYSLRRTQTTYLDNLKKELLDIVDQNTPKNVSQSSLDKNQIVENPSAHSEPQSLPKDMSSSHISNTVDQTIAIVDKDANNQHDSKHETKPVLKLTNDLKVVDLEKIDSSGHQKNDDFEKLFEGDVDRLMQNLREDDMHDTTTKDLNLQSFRKQNDEIVEQENLKNDSLDSQTKNPVNEIKKLKNNETDLHVDDKIEQKNEGISFTVPLKQTTEQNLTSKVLEHSQKVKSKLEISHHKSSSDILNFSKKSKIEMDDDFNRQQQLVSNLNPNKSTIKEESSFGLLSFMEVKHNEYFDDLLKHVDDVEIRKSSKQIMESQIQQHDLTDLKVKSEIKDDDKRGSDNVSQFKEDDQNKLNDQKSHSKLEQQNNNQQKDFDETIKSNLQTENLHSIVDKKSAKDELNIQNQSTSKTQFNKSVSSQQTLLNFQNAYIESVIEKIQNEINEVNDIQNEDLLNKESSKKDILLKSDLQKSTFLLKSVHIEPQEPLNVNVNVNVSQNPPDDDLQTNLSIRNKYLNSLVGKLQIELSKLEKKTNDEVPILDTNQIQKSINENPIKDDLKNNVFISQIIKSYLQNLIQDIKKKVADKSSEKFSQKQSDFHKQSESIISLDEKEALKESIKHEIENVDSLGRQSLIIIDKSSLKNTVETVQNEMFYNQNKILNVSDQQIHENIEHKKEETLKSDLSNQNEDNVSNNLSIIEFQKQYIHSLIDKIQSDIADSEKKSQLFDKATKEEDKNVEQSLSESKLATEDNQKVKISESNAPVIESMIGFRSAYLKDMEDKLQEQFYQEIKKEDQNVEQSLSERKSALEDNQKVKISQSNAPVIESMIGFRSAYLKDMEDKLQEQVYQEIKKEESVVFQSQLNQLDEHIEELGDSKRQQTIAVYAPVEQPMNDFRIASHKSTNDKLQDQINENPNSSQPNINQNDTKNMNQAVSSIIPIPGDQTPSSLSVLSQNKLANINEMSSLSQMIQNQNDQTSYVPISSQINQTNFIPIPINKIPVLEPEVPQQLDQSIHSQKSITNNLVKDFETQAIDLPTENQNVPFEKTNFDNKVHDSCKAYPNIPIESPNYSLNYVNLNFESRIVKEKDEKSVPNLNKTSDSQVNLVQNTPDYPLKLTILGHSQTQLPTMSHVINELQQEHPNEAIQDPLESQNPIEIIEHKNLRISFTKEEPMFVVEPSQQTDKLIKSQLIPEEEFVFQRPSIVGNAEEPETPTFQFLKNPNEKKSTNKWSTLETISEKETVNLELQKSSINADLFNNETPNIPLIPSPRPLTNDSPIVHTDINFVNNQSQSVPLLRPNESNNVVKKPQTLVPNLEANEPSFSDKLNSQNQKSLQMNDPDIQKLINQQKILDEKRGTQIHTVQVPDLDVKCDVQNKELTKNETNNLSKSEKPNRSFFKSESAQQPNKSIPSLSKQQLKIENKNRVLSTKLNKTDTQNHPLDKLNHNAFKISNLAKTNLSVQQTKDHPNSKIRRTINKQKPINYRNEPNMIELNDSYISDNSIKKSSFKKNGKSFRSKNNSSEINERQSKNNKIDFRFKKMEKMNFESNPVSDVLSDNESRINSSINSQNLDPSIELSEASSNISFDSQKSSKYGSEFKKNQSNASDLQKNSKDNTSQISENSFKDQMKRDSLEIEQKELNKESGKILLTFSEKEVIKKLKKKSSNLKKAFSTAGFCCFLFFFSFLTTVFLFKRLDDKIGQLNALILEPPTIKHFFEEYKNFFLGYEGSREFIKQVLTEEKHSEKYFAFQDYNAEIAKIRSLKSDLNKQALKLKMVLSSYQSLYFQHELLPVFNERILQVKKEKEITLPLMTTMAVDDGLEDESESNSFSKQELSLLTSKIAHKIDLLKDSLRSLQQGQSSQISYFQNLVNNYGVKMIEVKKLLNWFGNLYTLSNRIWVMTENIYQEAKKKFKGFNNEFKKNLYSQYYSQVDNLKLSLGDYVKWGRIDKFQGFKIDVDRPAVLFCQIQAKYQSKDSNLISQMFDFALVTNDKIDKNSIGFETEVNQKTEVFNIKSIIPLEVGSNDVSLFAQVKKEKIEFVYVSAKCLLVKEIKTIE